MVPIHLLWLPILLSAVGVFVASSLIHMVAKYHANDYRKLPDEDAFIKALLTLKIPPGEYAVPRPVDAKEMRTPEFQEKIKKVPGALLTTWAAGPMSIPKSLIQWFVYSLVIGVFAAYISGRALAPGAPYLSVFRFVGATVFMCYAVAHWQNSIWFRLSWTTTLRNTIDGLIYAVLSAGIYSCLWPG